jgi:hypothetical protein
VLGGAGAGDAAVRIANAPGGWLGPYVDKFQHLRQSGETIIVDGLCAAACTIVLGGDPRDKLCLTSNARVGFVAASELRADGRVLLNREATQMLYAMYPAAVRDWTAHMIVLQGKPLQALYRPCTIDTHASGSRLH